MCCCSTPPSCFLSREDLGEFYHRIFSRMKLNANIEQIEGKLYFNIRGEILVEVEIKPQSNSTLFQDFYMLFWDPED